MKKNESLTYVICGFIIAGIIVLSFEKEKLSTALFMAAFILVFGIQNESNRS
jgi:hypothetical protein